MTFSYWWHFQPRSKSPNPEIVVSMAEHQETCPAFSIGTAGYNGSGYREVQAMKVERWSFEFWKSSEKIQLWLSSWPIYHLYVFRMFLFDIAAVVRLSISSLKSRPSRLDLLLVAVPVRRKSWFLTKSCRCQSRTRFSAQNWVQHQRTSNTFKFSISSSLKLYTQSWFLVARSSFLGSSPIGYSKGEQPQAPWSDLHPDLGMSALMQAIGDKHCCKL